MSKAIDKTAIVVSKSLQFLDKGFNFTKVDDLTQKLRISICEGCEHFREDRTCGICKCPMDWKTTLKYDPVKSGLVIKKTLISCADQENPRW